jgi:transcriptional regulator GlxA family with amidase domain
VANRFTDPPTFRIFTVAEKPGAIMSRNGLGVNPHHLLDEAPAPEILLVPGGLGTRRELNNQGLISWIRRTSEKAELVLSVCTGSLLLARAGLLEGMEATTHHGSFELLRQLESRVKVHEDRRHVDNGRIITSGGIAAGIDMSFHVIARLLGAEVAAKTARQMEYPYQP